jgi:hypothetical protein
MEKQKFVKRIFPQNRVKFKNSGQAKPGGLINLKHLITSGHARVS